jgi:hypothetical protein
VAKILLNERIDDRDVLTVDGIYQRYFKSIVKNVVSIYLIFRKAGLYEELDTIVNKKRINLISGKQLNEGLERYVKKIEDASKPSV